MIFSYEALLSLHLSKGSYDYVSMKGFSPIATILLQEFFAGPILFYLLFWALAIGLLYSSQEIYSSSKKAKVTMLLASLLYLLLGSEETLPLFSLTAYLLLAYTLSSKHIIGFGGILSSGAMFFTYPLLGYFLVFFLPNKKKLATSLLLWSLFWLLLPLLWLPSREVWESYYEWVVSFRNEALFDEDLSILGLLRAKTDLSPFALRLLLINAFHFLLLPCLKVLRKRGSSKYLTLLFLTEIVTFVALFSSTNTTSSILALGGFSTLSYFFSSFSSLRSRIFVLLLVFGGVGSSILILGCIYSEGLTLGLLLLWIIEVIEVWRGTKKAY